METQNSSAGSRRQLLDPGHRRRATGAGGESGIVANGHCGADYLGGTAGSACLDAGCIGPILYKIGI